ncbi:hypothetical protein KL930_001636 [Ogataea haglerorum]|uniref:Peroxin-3 n=1 Tax=Ogataea haglerorum TaxID=1937702 RepID=A0AAN6D961_9ASCO|nr:uncharacterized protein KL911_001580 [Ogataea haglerorum]KAG7697974.1 hypothetical protein KL915_001691 [Ogataea haglerorum]KAG7708197.1 hypothetical protein KL914_001923 [Ogataea haglerorum]KAG7710776.1 hypothetical protein KL950_001689 [Ogataea haglerorum]KAG7729840.1 hypothetical protein KL933_000920 [Ogataea haglerorum]KAG7732732.1 hypothetical protein KL948_002162 [Ogataea haglerorum]
MFQYCRDLVSRHKKKLLFGTGVIAVSYAVSSYVSNKLAELQERLKEENFAKEQIKRRFKQTQNDCYMTFLSLLPVLTEPIYEALKVEDITRELQNKRFERQKAKNPPIGNTTDPAMSTVLSDDFSVHNEKETPMHTGEQQTKSKTQLWNELRNQSITRFLTLLYCESLLIVFLHLQLNILSRRSYLETAIKLASKTKGIRLENESNVDLDPANMFLDNDEELATGSSGQDENLAEQAFLSYSWWLLNKGWIDIKNKVETSVEDIFGDINPRQELSIDEFATLINKTQQIIDKEIYAEKESEPLTVPQHSSSTVITSLLPPANMEFFLLQQTNDMEFLTNFNNNIQNSENVSKLLNELKGYLMNDQVSAIISLLVTVGISKVLDNIVVSLINKQKNPDQEEQVFTEIPKVKLASLLASITKQSNQLTNNSLDNEVLYTLNNLQELDDLSASVYSNFDA